jgi:hypothetical protein
MDPALGCVSFVHDGRAAAVRVKVLRVLSNRRFGSAKAVASAARGSWLAVSSTEVAAVCPLAHRNDPTQRCTPYRHEASAAVAQRGRMSVPEAYQAF